MSYVISNRPMTDLSEAARAEIAALIKARPELLLSIREVRQIVAKERFERQMAAEGGGIRHLDRPPEDNAGNTIPYSIFALTDSVGVILDRPIVLAKVVTAIEWVANRAPSLKVLTVGPRSEIEIFGLEAMGFALHNIHALDLISYSPLVTVGDMHAMPFEDGFFDVLIMGWVFSYSANPAKAVEEILRCTHDGAIVAISNDWGKPDATPSPEVPEGLRPRNSVYIQNCAQILDYFPPENVGRIFFRQDANPPETHASMIVFEVRHPGAAGQGEAGQGDGA